MACIQKRKSHASLKLNTIKEKRKRRSSFRTLFSQHYNLHCFYLTLKQCLFSLDSQIVSPFPLFQWISHFLFAETFHVIQLLLFFMLISNTFFSFFFSPYVTLLSSPLWRINQIFRDRDEQKNQFDFFFFQRGKLELRKVK